MDYKIIPVTDFLRNFGVYAEMLPRISKLILTREGRPFAEVKASPQEKNKLLLKAAGMWKGTELDNDRLWQEVAKRKSRKTPITL